MTEIITIDKDGQPNFNSDELLKRVQGGHSNNCNNVIFEVNSGFIARGSDCTSLNKDKKAPAKDEDYDWYYKSIYIPEGTFIEFRYEHNAHCRDTNNNYFMIDPSVLLIKCRPFALINNDTGFRNELDLAEILAEKSYKVFAE